MKTEELKREIEYMQEAYRNAESREDHYECNTIDCILDGILEELLSLYGYHHLADFPMNKNNPKVYAILETEDTPFDLIEF